MRVVVVGTGSIARRHIANAKLIWPEDNVACVSSSGRSVASGEMPAAPLAGIDAAVEWRPDFAIIASPAPFHLSQAAIFAEAGIPMLLEKPVSHDLDEYDRWLPRLAAIASRIDVAYNLRFLSSAQRFHAAVRDGVAGTIVNVLVDVGQYLPDWRPGADYRDGVSARRDLGGGVLLELSHEFDYLRWIFGDFEKVYCIALPTGQLEVDVEDRADLILSGSSGLIANLHLDLLQRRPRRVCRVIGSEGTLVWDAIANSVSFEAKGHVEMLFSEPEADRNMMYLDQLRRFARVAQGLEAPLVGLSHARGTLALVAAAKRSATSGAAVSLGEGL